MKMTHVGSDGAHSDARGAMNLNWDDIRIFLKLAQLGSIRAVSSETGHSPAAVRNRISDLEAQTSAVLFHRTKKGMILTDTGGRLVAVAENIQRQTHVFATIPTREKAALRSTVRVGITEGLGVFWLAPMLGDLRSGHPDIQFDLKCSMTPPKISELEVDLAIQLDKPTDPNLMVRKIGNLHVVLYAAESYIAAHGAPKSKSDIEKHQFIDIVAPQIRSEKVEEEMTREDKRGFVNIRVNTSSAQFVSVISGLGVTALPTYAPVVSRGLVHVAKDFVLPRDIWLAYHPQAAELSHVRRTIDWVISSFNPAIYPWFREKYIAPAEIESFMATQDRKSLFTPSCALSLAS